VFSVSDDIGDSSTPPVHGDIGDPINHTRQVSLPHRFPSVTDLALVGQLCCIPHEHDLGTDTTNDSYHLDDDDELAYIELRTPV
jgi:hypothetical protein